MLEDQKLKKAYEALSLPTYEDVHAYLENSALINVMGAGYVFTETGGFSEAGCRRTIAAHRHFTQMPEPEKMTGNLPEIAAGVALDSPACLSEYPNMDPPVKAGEDDLNYQLGRMTIDCENAYVGLDTNAENICQAGYDSLTGAQSAVGNTSLKARDTAAFWRAYQGQMLLDLKLEAGDEAAVCQEMEAIWDSLRLIDPDRVSDPQVAKGMLADFTETLTYCRETHGQTSTVPLTPAPTPNLDLSDLAGISSRARTSCQTAAQSLPQSVTVEICRDWIEQLEASKARQSSSTDAELTGYWLALADMHAVLANAYQFIDQTASARACFQAEKAGYNVGTLSAASSNAEYQQAGAARETLTKLLPQCRQSFAKPSWGTSSF